jgi:hypothetical protein
MSYEITISESAVSLELYDTYYKRDQQVIQISVFLSDSMGTGRGAGTPPSRFLNKTN